MEKRACILSDSLSQAEKCAVAHGLEPYEWEYACKHFCDIDDDSCCHDLLTCNKSIAFRYLVSHNCIIITRVG